MIYDCFNFFNELDLLEIRLNVLNEVVDRFIIVEANRTHQGKPKPMNLEANWDRFKAFESKITYLKLEKGYPTFFTRFRPVKTWDIEYVQRELFFEGLKDAENEDRIIISDLDEIPNPKMITSNLNEDVPLVFVQKYFRYFLNGICRDKTWPGPVMLSYKRLKEINTKIARLHRDPKYVEKKNLKAKVITDGGWHFTTIGNIEKIIAKIEAFAHNEFNKEEFKDPKKLQKLVNEGGDIFGQSWDVEFERINDSYPQYLLDNQNRYKHLIKDTD